MTFIKYRNMWLQVLFYVLTLGIYGIYWYMVSLQEMQRANGKGASGCLWTFLLFVPIVSLLSYWRHASEYSQFVDDKYPAIIVFLLWIIFSPIVWFLVQSDLNRAANSR